MGVLTSIATSTGAYYLCHKPDIAIACGLFTFSGSLIPDLDIGSIPQRWFNRFVCLALLIMFIVKQHAIANIVAICALLPQTSKHRGYMHSQVFAILCPTIAFVMVYCLRKDTDEELVNILLICISMSIGWLVHLFLDSKLFRWT